jgi:hypothetical protein
MQTRAILLAMGTRRNRVRITGAQIVPQGSDECGECRILLFGELAAAATCQRLRRVELDCGQMTSCHERRTAMHSALKVRQVVSYF